MFLETACHLFEVLVLSDLVPHGLRGGRADQPLPVRHLNLQTLATEILYLLRLRRKYLMLYLSTISNNIADLHLQSPSQSQSYLSILSISISHLMLFLPFGFGLFAQWRQ